MSNATEAPCCLSPKEAALYSNALADVLCWFAGFQAATVNAERQPQMPPGIDTLRDLNIWLKGKY